MKNEDKFFAGIEDTLHVYEDAYVPGSWEAFEQKRKRNRMGMLFKLSSAAAVLLLLGYAAFQFYAKSPVTVQVVQNKKDENLPRAQSPLSPARQARPDVEYPASVVAHNPRVVAKGNTNKNVVPVIATAKSIHSKETNDNTAVAKPAVAVIAAGKQPAKVNDVVNPLQNTVKQDDATLNPSPAVTPDKVLANNDFKKPTVATKSVYDSLVNSKNTRAIAVADKKESVKNISYAVMVQPAVGNQKLNIGTSVEVAYNISDKIAITSGIGYASLNATSSGGSNNARLGQVQNVNLALAGVEVPIGVRYKTSGGFYISAGVMGMSVTNNSLEYSYIGQSAVASTMVDKQGFAYSGLTAVTENKVEESKEKVANYLGFYILSVGKKKAIGKKNNINFGPFLRVPFGAVSSEKIRLLQGGVTLGLGF